MKIEIIKNNNNLHKTILCSEIIMIDYLQNNGDINPYVSITLISKESKYRCHYDSNMDIKINFLKE